MIDVLNPATGEAIARVARTRANDVEMALERASKLIISEEERFTILKRLHSLLVHKATEVAETLALEQGKPIIEGLTAEVFGSLDHLKSTIRTGRGILAPQKRRAQQVLFSNKKSHIVPTPYGVVLVISPWNYPFAIPFIQCVQAVAAGSRVLIKCSSDTPLSAGLIVDLFTRAGAPPGLVTRLIVKGSDTEDVVRDPRIDKVLFTGSVEIGRRLATLCGSLLKPCALELGGKDPALVFSDADLDLAVRGIAWGAMMNAGQTCAGIERVYVEHSIYDTFVNRLEEEVSTIVTGDPMKSETRMGPMTIKAQREWVHHQVEEAAAAGARIRCGGEIPDGDGFFYPPTLLTNVDHTMSVMSKETFGPLLPVMAFKEEEEAIRLANDSPFGLTASVWTSSPRLGERVSARLEAGTVTVNDHMFSFVEPSLPWLGVKESGIGTSHGREGLMELNVPKVVSRDFSRTPRLWWYPYSDRHRKFFMTAINGLHGRGMTKWVSLARLAQFPFFWRQAPLFSILKNVWRLF